MGVSIPSRQEIFLGLRNILKNSHNDFFFNASINCFLRGLGPSHARTATISWELTSILRSECM